MQVCQDIKNILFRQKLYTQNPHRLSYQTQTVRDMDNGKQDQDTLNQLNRYRTPNWALQVLLMLTLSMNDSAPEETSDATVNRALPFASAP